MIGEGDGSRDGQSEVGLDGQRKYGAVGRGCAGVRDRMYMAG